MYIIVIILYCIGTYNYDQTSHLFTKTISFLELPTPFTFFWKFMFEADPSKALASMRSCLVCDVSDRNLGEKDSLHIIKTFGFFGICILFPFYAGNFGVSPIAEVCAPRNDVNIFYSPSSCAKSLFPKWEAWTL